MFENFLPLAAIMLLYTNNPVIKPRQPNFAIQKLLNNKNLIFAHRGGGLEGYEHSMSAIKNAIELGVDGIEITIRKTRDGKYILATDESLMRITGQNKFVSETNYGDIGPYLDVIENDNGGSFSKINSEAEKPPTLDEFFAFMAGNEALISISTDLTAIKDFKKIIGSAIKLSLFNRTIFNTGLPAKLHRFLSFKANVANRRTEIVNLTSNFMTGHLISTEEMVPLSVLRTTTDFQTMKDSPLYGEMLDDHHSFGDALHMFSEAKRSKKVMNQIYKQAKIPVVYFLVNNIEDAEEAAYLGANAIVTDRPALLKVHFSNRR